MNASIVCPQCGMRSHSPQDVRHGYCGNCHQFHNEMQLRGAQLRVHALGWVLFCTFCAGVVVGLWLCDVIHHWGER